jgi:hypothetical protein
MKAQCYSAIAGVLRVETGRYPRIDEILERFGSLNFSEEGLRAIEAIMKTYATEARDGTLAVDGFEGCAVPCLECLDFESEVGAGDASSAAFTYLLSVLGRKAGA